MALEPQQQPAPEPPPEAPEAADAPPLEEIADDAIAELERMDDARHASQELSGGDDWTSPLTPVLDPPYDMRADSPEPAPAYTKSKTIDDLFANHPEIGDGRGTKWIQVERKEPVQVHGVRCGGYLGELDERITMEQFKRRYGGGTYYLHVVGATRGLDADGKVNTRTLDTLRVVLPGNPKVDTDDGDEDMTAAQHGRQHGRATADVEITRMNIAARERASQRDEVRASRASSGIGPDVLEQIRLQGNDRVAEVQQASAENYGRLSRSNDRLQTQLERANDNYQSLRNEMGTLQAETATQLRAQETDRTRQITAQFEREKTALSEQHRIDLNRDVDDHRVALERVASENQRITEAANERHAKEREQMLRTQETERQRSIDEAARRETQLLDDAQRNQTTTREMYESRLSDQSRTGDSRLAEQQRAFDREVASLRSQFDREVASIRSMEEGKSTVSRESAKIQITTVTSELGHARSELDGLRGENSDLRSKLNKPVMEAIKDAHQLASQTGFQGSGGEVDWKQGLVSAFREFAQKGPEIARTLGETREQNRQAAIARRHAAQRRVVAQQQAAQQQQQQQHGVQQQPQQQQRGAPAQAGYRTTVPGMGGAPEPTWGRFDGPRDPSAAPIMTPPPPAQPVSTVAPPAQGAVAGPPAAQPAAAPMSGGDGAPENPNLASPLDDSATQAPDAPPAEAPPPAGAAPDAPPPPPAGAADAPPSPASENVFTEDQFGEFAGNLDLAIGADMPVDEFAAAFIERVGEQKARGAVGVMTADAFVDMVEKAPGGSNTSIATRKGRNYCGDLWSQVNVLTG